jgi:hypothetical protein
MQSTLDPRPIDPIARYLEQIASENEQIARTLADDAARPAPAAVKNVQVPGDRPSFGRPAVRGFVGLLLAACIGVAAFAWQSYGDVAKPIIAKWAPQLVQTSSLPLEKPGLPAQPSPPAVEAAGATAAPPQPAPLAQTAAEGVAPTAAAPSPESAQLLQSMARDLATARQEIEQLKTNQEQMTRDNARAAEQFKASQEQMARDIAKASELRPKTSAPPPRPTATPTRKPAPILPSPQARAQPEDTPQPQAEPELPSAPRLPVR